MSRLLSELLGANEPLFGLALRQLEHITANPSADVRLTAEIMGKVQLKTKDLGLDPKDTTGKELYYALVSKIENDDAALSKVLGIEKNNDHTAKVAAISAKLRTLDAPRSAWVLKKTTARNLLKKNPPKLVMKHLGYRSVDSMIKNENIFELFGAIRIAETTEWLNGFLRAYEKLKPSDFEQRTIELVVLPNKPWQSVATKFIDQRQHNVTYLKELGAVVVLPIEASRLRSSSILLLSLILHYMNEVRLYSSFFKLHQFRSHFGQIIADTLVSDSPHAAIMAGQSVHWRVIHRYFGSLGSEKHPEVFEPHLQPEDLEWRHTEEILCRIDSRLGWWRDLDYVGVMHNGHPVTFNIIDVAISYVNDLSYQEHSVRHFRDSLWNEIFIRYMGQRVLEEQILRQLDSSEVAPDTIAKSISGKYV